MLDTFARTPQDASHLYDRGMVFFGLLMLGCEVLEKSGDQHAGIAAMHARGGALALEAALRVVENLHPGTFREKHYLPTPSSPHPPGVSVPANGAPAPINHEHPESKIRKLPDLD